MPRLKDPRFATDCTVTVDGHPVQARAGESVASALVAAGRPILSRSAKYHRPRGPFCLSGSCGSCLVRVDGEPNRRACRTPCRDGMRVETQNAWPDAARDLLGVLDPLTPHGLDVHHMFTRPRLVNQALVAVTRRLAGFGTHARPRRAARPGAVGGARRRPRPRGRPRRPGRGRGARPGRTPRAPRRARGRCPEGACARGSSRTPRPPAGRPRWRQWSAAGGEVALGTTAAGPLARRRRARSASSSPRRPARTRLVRADRVVVCTGGHRPAAGLRGRRPARHPLRARPRAGARRARRRPRDARVAVLGDGPEAGRSRPVPGRGHRGRAVPARARGAAAGGSGAGSASAGGAEMACDAVAQGEPPAPAPELAPRPRASASTGTRPSRPSRRASAPTAPPPSRASSPPARWRGRCTAAEAAAWGRRAGEAARG